MRLVIGFSVSVVDVGAEEERLEAAVFDFGVWE